MWDMGSIPGSGRSPGGGHGNPLQSSCLENFMDRGALRATVHGVAKSWTQLRDLYFLPSRKEQVAVPKKFLLEGELLFSLFCKLPEAFRALGTERPHMCLWHGLHAGTAYSLWEACLENMTLQSYLWFGVVLCSVVLWLVSHRQFQKFFFKRGTSEDTRHLGKSSK